MLAIFRNSNNILAVLDSVASAADGIQREAYTKFPLWWFEPRPQPAAWINWFGRFNPLTKADALNPSAKQANKYMMYIMWSSSKRFNTKQ